MRTKALASIAVALVAGLAHVQALPGEFTFDDHVIVEENPRLAVHDLASARALLGSHYWGPSSERSGERLWRPVPLATYALERAVTREPAPRLSHAVNVIFHVLAAVLALALFWMLACERIALLGALVFAAHPLHSEAVAGIVGRAEVLALALGLLSLLAHTKRRGIGGAILEGAALFLALGSKESAIAVIPIAFVLDLARERRIVATKFIAPVVATALYVGLRAVAIGSLTAESSARTLGAMPLEGRAVIALAVLRDAWWDLLVPFRGTSAHFPLPATEGAPLAVAVLLQVAVIGSLGWVFSNLLVLKKKLDPRVRASAAAVLAVELALAPVLNLVPIGVVYAERLLYAPSVWASLVVGVLGSGFTRGRGGAVGAGLLVGTLAFASNRNDRAWRDDLTLWTASVARFPEEPRARLALGEVLLAKGDAEGAKTNFRFAVEHFPNTQPLKAKACIRLAQALHRAHPHDELTLAHMEAIECLALAHHIQPDRPDLWIATGDISLEDEKLEDAVRQFQHAIALAPESYEAHWKLGLALLEKDPASAERELTNAVELDSLPGEALFNRAEARWALGHHDGAASDYVRAAECLVAKGRRDEARGALTPKLARIPENERARVIALLSERR
jgi:tetratricopeptide (TPR) repeat protein